jgi:hypothetical protein
MRAGYCSLSVLLMKFIESRITMFSAVMFFSTFDFMKALASFSDLLSSLFEVSSDNSNDDSNDDNNENNNGNCRNMIMMLYNLNEWE